MGFLYLERIFYLTLITKTAHMKKVSHILSRKGTNIVSVSPQTSVLDALKLMADENIGSVMVMHEGEFVGVMTERDYSRKVILNGKSSTDTLVGDIMTIDFPAVTPNDSIDYCMTLMSENKLRYLPVFENHKVCSIISMSDVVTETIQGQAETISQLKDYLHSSL
jgi:CBS domain-containing protein